MADKELPISVQDPNNAPSTLGTENLDQMPTKTTETPKLPPSKASIKKERKFQDQWKKANVSLILKMSPNFQGC